MGGWVHTCAHSHTPNNTHAHKYIHTCTRISKYMHKSTCTHARMHLMPCLLQIATAGGPDKAAMLKRLGADRVIDYKQESLKVGTYAQLLSFLRQE